MKNSLDYLEQALEELSQEELATLPTHMTLQVVVRRAKQLHDLDLSYDNLSHQTDHIMEDLYEGQGNN